MFEYDYVFVPEFEVHSVINQMAGEGWRVHTLLQSVEIDDLHSINYRVTGINVLFERKTA